jgi:hypothetical protein
VIQLRDAATGAQLGSISQAQLDFLVDQLEEETDADQDYYIDVDTIALLEDAGADADLLGILRSAIGDREGIDVAWSEA